MTTFSAESLKVVNQINLLSKYGFAHNVIFQWGSSKISRQTFKTFSGWKRKKSCLQFLFIFHFLSIIFMWRSWKFFFDWKSAAKFNLDQVMWRRSCKMLDWLQRQRMANNFKHWLVFFCKGSTSNRFNFSPKQNVKLIFFLSTCDAL